MRPASASRPRETFSHLRSSTEHPLARGLVRVATIKGLSSLLRVGPPQCFRVGTLSARFSPLELLPWHQSDRLVPAVPRNSLHPLHAPSTPIAVRPVIRHPAGLSQVNHTLLVSTTLTFFNDASSKGSLSFVCRMLTCTSFSRFFSNAHHHGSLPQRLGGGLRPAPESRSRGAHPHLSRSLFTRLFSS